MAILLKICLEKVDFFLAILTSLMAALDAQQNFMSKKFFFLSISVRTKVIVFFDKYLPKLNILSVIAID